jgi:hypothetical protein
VLAVQRLDDVATPGGALPYTATMDAEFDLANRLNRLPFYAPAGFGGVVEDLQALISKAPALLQKGAQIIDKAGPHLDTVMAVVQDPALPGLINRVKTLQALQAAKSPPTAPGAPTAPSTDTGIKNLFPLLDAAIVVEKSPVLKFATEHPVLVGAGALLLLTGIGFGIGRLTKRCRIPSPSVTGHAYRRRRS